MRKLSVSELLNITEFCIKSGDKNCRECPLYHETYTFSTCNAILVENLYKLLTVLSEKIVAGELTSGIAQMASQHWYRQNQEYITILKAEIERLEKINKILSDNADTAFQDGLNEAQELYAEQIKHEVKTEVCKEYAMKLKAKATLIPNDLGTEGFVTIDDIYQTLKEMGCN